MNERIAALAQRFQRLGCKDPEGWARSEIEENIPQLARFVFLRELWKLVITEETSRKLNDYAGPNDDGRGGALRRIKECGVNRKDLLTVVREAQADVVRGVAFVFDQVDDLGPDLRDVSWGLFELNNECNPTRDMGCLHESVDDEDVSPFPS